jgi:hypothetical protein
VLRSRAELADHIAAVLAHPMTSARLFNAIADELSDLLEYDWTTPEMVLRALNDDAGVQQQESAPHSKQID